MKTEEIKENIIKALIPLLESKLSGGCLKMSSDFYDEKEINTLYFRTSGNDYTARRNKKLLDFMNKLDIDSIPESTREHLKSLRVVEIYDKYNKYEDDYIFENKTTNEYPLLKSNIKIDRNHYILSATEVVKHLEKMYGFTKNDFYTSAPNEVEIVKMNLAYDFDCMSFGSVIHLNYRYIEHNRIKILDIIDKECAVRGYFRAATQICHDKKGDFYIKCIYDPVRDIPIKEMILKERLYHCSYTDNYDSIMDNGLIPQNKGSRTFDYPNDRLFFYVEGPRLETNDEFADMMHGVVRPRKERGLNTEMYVFEIMTPRRLPENVEFFYDLHQKDCIYCTKPIPSKCLDVMCLVDFGVVPAYFDDAPDTF